jgi:TRAP-type mannitol/chloroaromatic compound transport system substrate-binding protein
MLEGDGGRIHRDAYEKLGVTGIPCGMQGGKGGGWYRGDFNTVADFKGQRLRFGKFAAEVVARLGATVVPMPPAAAWIRTVSPACTSALSYSVSHAVSTHSGRPAVWGWSS